MKILLALTEEMVARPLQASLEFHGQLVEIDPSGADVMQLVESGGFDALVADPTLPHDGGLQLIRAVRRVAPALPIVVLSRFADVRHKILCFEAGADDHMLLPFDAGELFARLQAIARRATGRADGTLRCGGVAIDPAARTVRVHDAPVHFTAVEFGTIEALALRAGRAVSRDQLYSLTHGRDADSFPKVVDVVVSRIRKKLAAAGAAVTIETVRLTGYRLEGV